jgi:hypothetical protein
MKPVLFSIAVLFVGVAAILAPACGPMRASWFPDCGSGAIVRKHHQPSSTTYIWISHGKYGGHLQPIFHPEYWTVTINGKCSDGEYRDRSVTVDEDIYERSVVGLSASVARLEKR